MKALLRSLPLLFASCFIPYGGDLEDPQWSADGKEIFYLEQRFLSGPHPYEYFRLWRAEPDLSGRKKLASGSVFDQAHPSVDGRYLLFEEAPALIVYDLERERRVWSETFGRGGVGNMLLSSGWADPRTIFLTDRDGIRLVSIPDGGSRTVTADSDQIGLAGSRDGRLLLFSTGNGWSDGNQLTLYDRTTGKQRLLASVPSGLIGPAHFLEANRIAYVVQLIEGKRSQVVVVDHATGESRKVWEGDVHQLYRMEPSRDEQLILFSGEEENSFNSSLFCVGVDGSEHRIPSKIWNIQWDYDPASDRIISAEEEDAFRIRSLAELGCRPSGA